MESRSVQVAFIPFMLCERLTDPRRLEDRRYIAEPKLDGQRAQLHVAEGRAVACYSRRGLDLLRHAGMAWLRGLARPFASAVLDGEMVASDGNDGGVYSVLEERNKPGGHLAFLAFDLLEVGGRSIMREPWTSRRKRLEDLLHGRRLDRVGVVPVTDDAPLLWDTWVSRGGEGIVLKERTSTYRPGMRSPGWLKLKPKVYLVAVITGGSAEPIPWGDWGLAVNLELRYTHPQTGRLVEIRQAIRIPRDQPFRLKIGQRIELVCWGIMPSGMLRHPLLSRYCGSV